MKTALGRKKGYTVIQVINTLKMPPFKEVITVKDFTGKRS